MIWYLLVNLCIKLTSFFHFIEKQHPGKKGLLKKALANHNKAKNAKNVNPDDELTCQLCYKHYNSIETKERHLATFHKQNEYIQKLSSQMNQENLVKAQKGNFYFIHIQRGAIQTTLLPIYDIR